MTDATTKRRIAATGKFHERMARAFDQVGRAKDAADARKAAAVCARKANGSAAQ